MFDLFLLCILSSSCCCFCFCCFGVLYYFDFWLSKISLKNLEIAKQANMKNAEKKDTGTRAVSTGVLTNSVFFPFCVSLIFACFAENTIKIGVSAKRKRTKTQKNKIPNVKNWSKLALKTGPSMSRNKVGPVFNTRIGSFFCFFFLFLILFFLQGKQYFQKQKPNNEKLGPVFNTKKGKTWTSF